ncbi:MAG TPA: PP2C family protein-serine/threonine phosphatase [Streptosporangiaceae bacterium]|nr:PP2C family protein-serine/threonine phosphatase [Streptosporangiaceae bacterium]
MLTTDPVQPQASRPGTAALSARPEAATPLPSRAPIDPVVDASLPERGTRARLTAELAMQRHVTLELQRAILPLHDEPFDLPGLRAVVRYLPASSASRVGGDWYITAELPGDKVLLAIGDVAGHGLAAAAGMARLRGALAGLSITGFPPQQLVGWLNDLALHVGLEHTASVVAGYFDPASRMLTWAQAGHPPPVLIRGPWARPLPQPEGILLGACQCSYGAATVQLQPGDVLLMYSDGLLERRDQHLDEGLAMLLEAVRQISDPELVVSAALSALGSDPEDDTCLVALQVLDSGLPGQR